MLVPPGKPDLQAIHCPTTNFGPPSRGSITSLMLITAFDAYLTPMSLGTVSLVHESVNLNELYNEGIREKVTTKKKIKKEYRLHMKSQTPES